MVFDIVIANADRHAGNIKIEIGSGRPYVFDHDRCLLHVIPKAGVKRLKSMKDRLGLDGTLAPSSAGSHCLIQHLQSYDDLMNCLGRIENIPDWYIEMLVEDRKLLLITKREANAVSDFLKQRRDTLGYLLGCNKQRFTKIPADQWGLL